MMAKSERNPNETLLSSQPSKSETQGLIMNPPVDESARLRDLHAEVRDQDDLERDINLQADRILFEQASERDRVRLEKTKAQREKLQLQIRKTREQISQPVGVTRRARLKNEVDKMQGQIQDLDGDIAEIQERMRERENDMSVGASIEVATSGRLPHETQREFLIRTGKITPFSTLGLSAHGESSQNLSGALLDAEEEPEALDTEVHNGRPKFMSHRNLRKPGFARDFVDSNTAEESDVHRPRKRQRVRERESDGELDDLEHGDDAAFEVQSRTSTSDPEDTTGDDSDMMPTTAARQKRSRLKSTGKKEQEGVEDLRGLDDGNESVYRSRLRRWASRRYRARRQVADGVSSDDDGTDRQIDDTDDINSNSVTDFEDLEAHMPHPELPDTEFDGGYKIPGDIFPSLFDYQKTGVQWLYELSVQQVGGIIGDEMGLGKTIQIIAFLAGLHYSKKLSKPIIVVCPATVMKQWVNEFHRWWPPFRVTILHSSGSGMINVQSESSKEERLMEQMWDPSRPNEPLTAAQRSARRVIRPILDQGGVLVTTYSGLQTYAPLLIPVDWEYAILDEGHKIRNPNTAITIYCKELRTANRIILSGTPMQNNLIELWSLFDFVFPMRLGTLVSFRNTFEIPIRQGGYANASNLQVQTALKCAEQLKDAISPYLLQRFKVDVASDLPKKSEQVLFCKLTKLQRNEYERFLGSGELDAIMGGKRQVLYGVDILRKICNHPDLQAHKNLSRRSAADYGNPAKSGKMQVVGSLLELWKETGHKTLLFAQHRIMLDILEKYVRSMPGLKYRRMDGNTPIPLRQSMVDEFNTDLNLHVFLLTTKVGGLGVNLTGADRVIIYDPDWNPSTDLQARERAWRLGQKREVTIYRLMTAGTIEEKIYHRQIFKQFLTNKILKDPKQRQTFHLSDLHDLFSLGNDGDPTETSLLFKDAQVKQNRNKVDETAASSAATNEKGAQPKLSVAGSFETSKVSGISRTEQYAGEIAEEIQASESNSTNSDSRVLEGIFARSGIHSAVEHESIIGGNSGNNKPVADPVLIEQEAKKVAAEAARELRKAGEFARTVPVGTPTWTGIVGISGRPQELSAQGAFAGRGANRGNMGLGSGSLLAGLGGRPATVQGFNEIGSIGVSGTASPTGSSRAGTPIAPRGKDFGKLIKDYMLAHGGSVFTQMLIDHFNRLCTTPQANAEFKETLKAIARLEKGGRGRGRWVLKEEFKG